MAQEPSLDFACTPAFLVLSFSHELDCCRFRHDAFRHDVLLSSEVLLYADAFWREEMAKQPGRDAKLDSFQTAASKDSTARTSLGWIFYWDLKSGRIFETEPSPSDLLSDSW